MEYNMGEKNYWHLSLAFQYSNSSERIKGVFRAL